MLQDHELRRALGEAGPAHVAEHYLGSVQVLAYERLYRRLLDGS